jgi:hypothetical protein
VFNFGATLYWCVTDRHIPTLIPKKKNSGVAAIDSRELVLPHVLNPRVPQPLSRLIMDCVQNRPSHRPRDMADVHSRLELALSVSRSASTVPDTRPNVSQTPLVTAIPETRDESKDDSL